MDPNRLREIIEVRHPDAAGWDARERGLDADEARLLEQMLASDPELAAELARVEAWDVELEHGFHDVPVPTGLAERLLAAHQPVAAANAPVAEIVPVTPAVADVALPARRFSRRAWFGALAGLAAAILVVAGLTNWALAPQVLSVDTLLEGSHVVALELPEGEWSVDWKSPVLAEHPFDSSALVVRPVGWQRQSTALDSAAIVYDLAGPRRKAARLLVYRMPGAQSSLASFPTRTPRDTTGGYALGAWQRGDLVFVLVVEGNAARYGSFIKELTTG